MSRILVSHQPDSPRGEWRVFGSDLLLTASPQQVSIVPLPHLAMGMRSLAPFSSLGCVAYAVGVEVGSSPWYCWFVFN